MTDREMLALLDARDTVARLRALCAEAAEALALDTTWAPGAAAARCADVCQRLRDAAKGGA